MGSMFLKALPQTKKDERVPAFLMEEKSPL